MSFLSSRPRTTLEHGDENQWEEEEALHGYLIDNKAVLPRFALVTNGVGAHVERLICLIPTPSRFRSKPRSIEPSEYPTRSAISSILALLVFSK